ncbi:glycoside hydrolase [Achaetomium macrosporum]|uniref:Glycoside hydrolase n=1 Tax=Achaetomium macrosporum TaxID=79813 RepID=A0AAN7C2Y3_9PEZI|nr:glycoside hydrolase [Achaetomium macrosporum]
MRMKGFIAIISLAVGSQGAAAAALVSSPGETAAIPAWDLQSTVKAGTDLEVLSRPGLSTLSWNHVRKPKCTLIGCLIEAGVYNETELFYSDNLRRVDQNQFSVPWIYRSEFSLEPGPGKHFSLQTHGISSRADIFLNGKRVVSSSEQAGSYVGRTYDITTIVNKANALAIQVHPTDYYRDLAIGWVDWNPWPADNGTGVWRDIEIKQTGAVRLEPLRVVTQLGTPIGRKPASVTVKARAVNHENSPITITAACIIASVSGEQRSVGSNKTLTLPPRFITDITLDAVVENPSIWWPRQWGDQPLYVANLTITTNGSLLDCATSEFGFRTVTRTLNSYNDTTYFINGHPFQVIGAGYAPDMFLRWSAAKWEAELQYVLDLGFNTVRLEGKNEHPALYSVADRLGIMLMAGWECCDKWEAWSYNNDLAVPTPIWTDADYATANLSMLHEAAMLQPHPSVLTYLIGSDYWPDERATALYLSAFRALDWQTPITPSASSRGFSPQTGPSGMKMDGPYDWVPPNYWYDAATDGSHLGAAAGFNSELSSGVGTPELPSLRKFLSPSDLAALWRQPNASLFHMSRDPSTFQTRTIYNAALWARWGPPTSLDDYLIKAQIMDYEATRAQVEAYTALWGTGTGSTDSDATRPATGMIYWMLNNAWPGLHWNLWDYYMRPAGAYYGAKTAAGRKENVVFDYVRRAVWVVNRSLDRQGKRSVEVEVLRPRDGRVLFKEVVTVGSTRPNTSQKVASLDGVLGNVTVSEEVVFLRLVLLSDDGEGDKEVLSRNVYWVARGLDELDWESSEWYVTPVSEYADYTALNKLPIARVSAIAMVDGKDVAVTLENQSGHPAFFVSLNLVDSEGRDVLPLMWEDNYVTLWPKERITLRAKAVGGRKWEPAAVHVVGKNVGKSTVRVRRK